ncbi:hypothetical protein B1H18_14455 [Streptomyces tsukubensis]|uniref:Uncharacterized protein n=2 Tax=Streptomyces tsukubensis TaxID=83656 RepID=A0A1V4A9D1_9ACTN|nr:hypothetical protein B1H18_14455 [Streptomyces tsukubensis]
MITLVLVLLAVAPGCTTVPPAVPHPTPQVAAVTGSRTAPVEGRVRERLARTAKAANGERHARRRGATPPPRPAASAPPRAPLTLPVPPRARPAAPARTVHRAPRAHTPPRVRRAAPVPWPRATYDGRLVCRMARGTVDARVLAACHGQLG